MLGKLEVFIKRKIRHGFRSYYKKKDIAKLKNKDFVLISRNCWGGQVYQWFNIPYNTPFVGLFLFGPCYMKLLRDFDSYMAMDITFTDKTKYPGANKNNSYPVVVLDDIEIHFQHYESVDEAREKWNRRKNRMLKYKKEDYFFSICDRRGVTDEHIKEFNQMNFKNKISFSFTEIEGLNSQQHIRFIQKFSKNKNVPPNGRKRFKLSFLYFDLVNYLNTNNVVRTRFKT